MDTTPAVLTIRDIKRLCPGFSIHQIKYAISEYDIAPRGRVGLIRIWNPDDLPAIKSALSRIASRREVFHAS